MGWLHTARSALSLLLVLLWLAIPGAFLLYLIVLPLVWLRPAWDRRLGSPFVRLMSRGILGLMRLGGARFERSGRLATEEPGLVLMNHQSLLDIPTAMLLGPSSPAFISRARYRVVPVISTSIRLIRGPVIDPGREGGRTTAGVLQRAALAADHALLIYPEGHRSYDGEIHAFKSGGIQTILTVRRLPVWLVVTDGFWAGRRLIDFVRNVHHIRGRTEVIGRFEPPEREEEIAAFVTRMREIMVARLHQMRERHAAVA